MRTLRQIKWLGLLGTLLLCWPTHASFTIADKGKGQAIIVVAAKSLNPLVLKYAADELQRVIHKASGVRLAIVREEVLATKKFLQAGRIFIGPCRAAQGLGLDVSQLPANSFYVKTEGKQLFLVGKDGGKDPPRNDHVDMGTLFAVYEFLERQLNVRWLWPGDLGEFVPQRKRITSGRWQMKSVPRLIQQHWRLEAALHLGREGWSSPNRVYDYKVDLYKWSRRHRFIRSYRLDYPEAFRDYWRRFGKTHPQFFNLLPDGRRKPDGNRTAHVSMCVSQPALWKQMVLDWRKNRTTRLPWVNAKPNDTPGKCVCKKCLSWDVGRSNPRALSEARDAFSKGDKHGWIWPNHLGSLSDRYARFLLEVQNEAQKVDKDATVISYAYANYTRPPLKTKLNRRVVIAVASSLFFPYTEQTSGEFRRDWQGWSNTGARLIFRPNITWGSHNLPVHYARRVGADIQFAFRRNVIATDLDSLTGMWANQGPSLYVIARMQLRPEKSVDSILNEYYSAFGPAKAAVRDYFDHWEKVTKPITRKRWKDIVDKNRELVGEMNFRTFLKVAHEIYTADVMRRGRQLLDKATRLAAQDPLAARRVAFLGAGLRDAQLTLDAQRSYREFRRTGKRAPFTAAVARLRKHRHSIERNYVLNLSYVTFQERLMWK